MDRKRAAAALLALAACIACSTAAPTASDQTALELMDGPTEGCYYNFQHYGEGDRIMTNEPCLNCTCHNRMLMCYLRVCPFTKPIGQDCTVEKRADQCCPIVTCPDVPVDLLTSTSTSSPAEYGTTGVGKLDKYGCSINGKYFSEGSKVPSSPNKPCEHCYCIRNMTTCVMQECTLHVDGCTPIYHKEVCCPVRYSCDHPEDDILLLDDMTTTVRPTPGFLLTTTTAMPVTQMSQDCVHDDQIFPDGTLIKTEKACEHCYCMKGDIVCVVQECGTPMENEGKNCTSLAPRIGQCCPDTYICEGDDRGTEFTTEILDQSTQPPRGVGVEGSGFTIEPEEPLTETSPFETDIEGSGEEYATDAPKVTVEHIMTEKIEPDIIDEMLMATTEKEQLGHIPKADKDENIIPGINSGTESSDFPNMIAQTTEANVILASIGTESVTTVADEHKTDNELITKEDVFVTTESAFRKEDSSIVSDEMMTIKEQEKLPTTSIDLVDDTTQRDEKLNTDDLLLVDQSATLPIENTSESAKEKETIKEDQSQSTSTDKNKLEDGLTAIPEEEILSEKTTVAIEILDTPETTSVSTDINEVDEDVPVMPSPGRIPGEGDCLLNGITYRNNTIVPSSNNCHTSCKCVSSIVKCDPIICSSPPEYMENMNDCQPIYDSPDACCPTYVCSGKETIPPQSHSQMSGTETPKPMNASDCNGQQCILDEEQKSTPEPTSTCTSEDCLHKPVEKQDQGDCGSNNCAVQPQKPINQDCHNNNCQIQPVVACEGENCIKESESSSDLHNKPILENIPSLDCSENGDCKKPEGTKQTECTDEICRRHESTKIEQNLPSVCIGSDCTQDQPILHATTEQTTDVKTEKTSTDSATHISLTELDTDNEPVSKTTSAIIDENKTENPTLTYTKLAESLPSEKLSTISETFADTHDTTEKSDITVAPMIQNIPEREEDTNVTEETGSDYVTDSSVEIGKDKDTKVTQPDQTNINTEKVDSETSDDTEIKLENNFTEKMEITTEKLDTATDVNLNEQMYTTIAESDSESQKVHTNIPEINENDLDKLSTEPTVSASEKESTMKEQSHIYEDINDKIKLPVTIDIENTQTENIIQDFNKITNIYETSQTTSGTPERFDEKATETTESYITITDKNDGEITDVTPSVYLVTKYEDVNADKIVINTDSHAISTEQPTATKEEELPNDVTTYPQYIPIDDHEMHTESFDQYTTKVETTTSNIPVHHADKISHTEINSEVTEESITEKVTPLKEISETLPTKTNEIDQEGEKQKPESQEIHTEVTEKLDGTSTSVILEKEIDTVTETKFAVTTESGIPKTHSTSTQDLITKNYDSITESHTEQPLLSTISPVTMKETEIEDTYLDLLEKLLEESRKPNAGEETHISSDINTTPKTVKTSTTKMDEQYTEETDVIMTTSTPLQTTSGNDNVILTENDATKDIDKQDFESHKLPTTSEVPHEITDVTQEFIAETPLLTDEKLQEPVTEVHEEIPSHTVNDIDTSTQKLIPVTESQTKSPLGTDEKSQDTVTDIQEELPSQTDINEIDTATEQHLTVTEVQTKSPLGTDDKLQEPVTEIQKELPSQTDINEIDTATELHLAVTEVQTKSPLVTDDKLQEPVTEIHKELPSQTDINEIDSATEQHLAVTEVQTKPPLVTDEKLQEPGKEIHEELPSQTDINEIDTATEQHLTVTEVQTTSPLVTDEKLQEPVTEIYEEIPSQTENNEIDTVTEQHLAVTEVQTKSPLVTDDKLQEPVTEIHKELPSQTDINEIDSATEQHLAVTEVQTKPPLVTDEKLQEPGKEIHEELPSQTDINEIDTATEQHLTVTEVQTSSPLVTDEKLQEPVTDIYEELPSQTDVNEINTATEQHLTVTEVQTKSPLVTDDKLQEPVTEILKELPSQTDINEIDTATEQHLAVTEVQTKSPLVTDDKLQESVTEIHKELPSQTDINEIDTATEQHLAVTEVQTKSPFVTDDKLQEPVTEIHKELPSQTDINEIDTATEQHLAVTEVQTKSPLVTDDKLQEPEKEIHEEFPSQTITNDIDTATQEQEAVIERQTKSPLVTDEKSEQPTIDDQGLPSQTDINDIETATQELIAVTEHETKSPLVIDEESQKPTSEMHTIKPDESMITSSPYSETQSGFTTEHYVTESQKVNTDIGKESQTDSSTAPSILDHKLEESIDTGESHEKVDVTETKITTASSQGEESEIEKETTVLVQSDVTSKDLEKTTASLISMEDKGTVSLSHVTESYIDNAKEKETIKTTAGLIAEKEVSETTEKSVSDEELHHITSQPTHEVIPEQGLIETGISQTSHDVFTEKTDPLDSYETHGSTYSSTKQPDLYTKPEELGITESTLGEKEIMTETSEDFNKISSVIPTDQKYSNTGESSGDHEQILTTHVGIKAEEDREITMTPISFITDIDQVTEISSEEKNKISVESSTTGDQDFKENTLSDLYNPEAQTEISEKVKDVITEHDDSDTGKIITTETPAYSPTSHLHETTVSPSEEEMQITLQKTTTENILEHTELNKLHPTLSELDTHDAEKTPDSTEKVGPINVEEPKTTPISLDDSEQITIHYPEHQTSMSPSKDDIPSDLPHKEFTTLAPKLVEKDNNDITATIIPSQNPTTLYPEIITEKEKSTETIDLESHTITTAKPSETEIKVDEDVKYSTTEVIPSDKPTGTETEPKESDIMKQEYGTTQIPLFTEIQMATDGAQPITEKQEITESESLTKGIETTEPQYTTLVEQKGSSTGMSYMTDKPQEDITKDSETLTVKPHEMIPTIIEDTEIKNTHSTIVPYHTEMTTPIIDSQSELDTKQKLTTEDTNLNIETTKPTIIETENVDQPEISNTQSTGELHTEEHITQKEADIITTESVPTSSNVEIAAEQPMSTEKQEEPYVSGDQYHTVDTEHKVSETTPFLVELEEHTHLMVDETSTKIPLEEIATTILYETHESPQPERGDQIPESLDTSTISADEYPLSETSKTTTAPLDDKKQPTSHLEEQIDDNAHPTITSIKSETDIPLITEKTPSSTSTYVSDETKKDTAGYSDEVVNTTTLHAVKDKDYTTESTDVHQTPSSTLGDVQTSSEKDIHLSSEYPLQPETSEEKLTSEVSKQTTVKVVDEESSTQPSHIDSVTKPKEKPVETTLRPAIPEVPKPEFIDEHNEEIPSPDFPPSGGYGQEPDYIDEDQAFGPGTCRYGGKVYVSAQQIPRDDPCDFCFCFRSDIICLQQSCPPPIHGCHEEPIQGFCCPRYECPVSMATTLNVTTTTTTTTTTLPPHFLPHAYKGAAQRRGCQIKGHTYKVGEVVRASSGPCLHCTCGGDGQMKCDPKACTPEPMLRQMIAAAVSAKRRR